MTSEKIIDAEVTEVVNSGEVTDEELESLLSSEGEGDDEFKTEFVDERMTVITRARSLIIYWHQLHQQISQIKEGYSLAKMWDDAELKNQYMEQGRPLIKKEKILNDVVKDVLGELKDVPFLTQAELMQLPKWMLKILNVRIDVVEEETASLPDSALVQEDDTEGTSAKSSF